MWSGCGGETGKFERRLETEATGFEVKFIGGVMEKNDVFFGLTPG